EASLKNCASELVGAPTAQKGSVEPKRKVVKRSKLEKDRELFELAQQYHKVVAERDAAIGVKEKLESLCREFQRQNKMLKEECQRVSTEGQNMRMELSEKFDIAIKGVSVKLEEQRVECIAQLEENNMLRSKLKDIADQYNITQQKYAHQLKEKMMELELADLRLQQHQEKAAHEHTQMQLYAEQVSQLMTTEKNLRLQLASDGERFQHFQDALSKSNEVFETYKQEMEKMILNSDIALDLEEKPPIFPKKCEHLGQLADKTELTRVENLFAEVLSNMTSTLLSEILEIKDNSLDQTNISTIFNQDIIRLDPV
ncbi:hypothetical protein ACJX0J_038462, partial [Zea mays]